jgi:hypothetical protein
MSPPHVVGLANGFAQSLVSLGRFVGPVVGGLVSFIVASIAAVIRLLSAGLVPLHNRSGVPRSTETQMDTSNLSTSSLFSVLFSWDCLTSFDELLVCNVFESENILYL